MQRDLDLFTGHTDQYVFIATASAYEKPMKHWVVTEDVPLINPYWEYSRNKAQCEAMLQGQDKMPYTIVRPSHTSRNKLTTAMGEDVAVAHRMLAGKPIVVPGDGTNIWTITRAEEFAPPFVKLLGNDRAMNDHFHLTSPNAYAWDNIYRAMGRALGVDEVQIVHVATETLIRYQPDWDGPLRGDKAYSVTFDNRKIKSVVGEFDCPTTLDQFMIRPRRSRVAKSYIVSTT